MRREQRDAGPGFVGSFVLTAGSRVAGYRVIRELGQGGMGAVYLAQHPTLPSQDALKERRSTRHRSLVNPLNHDDLLDAAATHCSR